MYKVRICADVVEDRLEVGKLCRGPIAYIERAKFIECIYGLR